MASEVLTHRKLRGTVPPITPRAKMDFMYFYNSYFGHRHRALLSGMALSFATAPLVYIGYMSWSNENMEWNHMRQYDPTKTRTLRQPDGMPVMTITPEVFALQKEIGSQNTPNHARWEQDRPGYNTMWERLMSIRENVIYCAFPSLKKD